MLGEVWVEQGEQTEPSLLIARREEYPDDLAFNKTTMGIDVQKDRLEIEHVGWQDGEESWSLDYIVLAGDTAQPTVWDELAELISDLAPDGVAIDSGYNTSLVYDFVSRRKFAFAVKGVSGFGLPLIEDIQKRVKRLARRRKKSVGPEPIGVDQGKALVYSYLNITTPGPGYCHFPADIAYDDEWAAQLCSERLVTRYTKGRPKQEWVPTRARNEALDCRVYALSALRLLGTFQRKPRRIQQKPEENEPVAVVADQQRKRWTINAQESGAWL